MDGENEKQNPTFAAGVLGKKGNSYECNSLQHVTY